MTALKLGRLPLPPAADAASFLISGGKLTQRLSQPGDPASPGEHSATIPWPVATSEAARPPAEPVPKRPLTLAQVWDLYEAKLTTGAKEQTTRITEAIHGRHLCRVLGPKRIFEQIGLVAVQEYVDARVREGVVRVTIRKEVCTLRFVAEWACRREFVNSAGDWRLCDLTLPKSKERAEFQTWDQIVRQIRRGDWGDDAQKALWESLWLSEAQTVEFLEWASGQFTYPWLFPMLAIAAYTGARRGEILRSEIDDWDLGANRAMLRQKKADSSKEFTRRFVPIPPDLVAILDRWLANHPGGSLLIASPTGRPIRPVKASDSFRMAVKGSKWSVLRGFHVLRHSLASNLATQGIDQRIIDDILGHSTAEMARRSRHLGPDQKLAAVAELFGGHPPRFASPPSPPPTRTPHDPASDEDGELTDARATGEPTDEPVEATSGLDFEQGRSLEPGPADRADEENSRTIPGPIRRDRTRKIGRLEEALKTWPNRDRGNG